MTRCALPRPATIASRTRSWANRRSPGAPSSRTSAARAASSSDVRQSPTFLPVIAATRGTANRVPSSAAARSDAAQSGGKLPEPLADRVEHRPGHGPRERGPVGELAGELAHEERVARRGVVHRSQLGVAGRSPDDAGDLLADGGSLQATQLDLGGVGLLGQGGEGAGRVAAADDDQETVVACRACEVLHQQLRRFVRAVQVVEDDEQRATPRGPEHEPGHLVEPPHALLQRRLDTACGHIGQGALRWPARRSPVPAAPPATASTAARRPSRRSDPTRSRLPGPEPDQ